MVKSSETKIIDLINKKNLSKDERIELIDELYWTDWDILKEKDENIVEKIFAYINKENLSDEETSKILRLYNNVDGAHIRRFTELILNIYKTNKKKFLRSLNLEKEEAINIVYIFRMNDVKLGEDTELLNLMESDELSKEEINTAREFLKMYETICKT